MNEQRFLRHLGSYFPRRLSAVWDHPLYQCGKKDMNKEIRKVFLCLDYSEFCYEECLRFQPDIILTHHPFYFGKRREIRENDIQKAKLEDMTRENIGCPIYSYHTCYDFAKEGMNKVFADEMGFPTLLVGKDEYFVILDQEMTTIEIKELLEKKIAENYRPVKLGMLSEDPSRKHKIIAFCLGGASNGYHDAIKAEATLYITGDSRQNNRLEMRRYHLDYLELPHETEEKYFLKGMSDAIHKIDPDIELDCFSYMEYLY